MNYKCSLQTKPSNSNASSDAASSRSSKSEKKRRFSDIQDDSSESLLEPMATKNDEDESSDFSVIRIICPK